MLLRVAARPRRGSRVGSYVGRQAQTPAIRASFVDSSGSAAMHNRDGCARRQAPPRAKLRHGLGLHREKRAVRRLDSVTMPEGDRASTSGAETRWTHPARENVFFRPVPKTARNILFFGTGEKGNQPERSGNQSTFERAVTEWAKKLRSRRTAAAGRHTKTRDRCSHHHESSCRRIYFWIFDEAVPF